jgi:DNA end-binding protein Ku
MSRPIWTGSISFGLVSIPIELVMAIHEKTVHFHMVSKDGACRLRRKLYCPETGKEYDFEETAKGVEVGPNDFAVVNQKEINRLKPQKGRALEIVQFVDLSAVDPVYFDRVYYLRPTQDSRKAYKLLLEAMQKGHKCAISQFVMREREYLAVIRAAEDGMILHTLNYADEIESLSEAIGDDLAKIKTSSAQLSMANELVKAMTKPLDMQKFKDDYRLQLQKLVDAKVKGKEIKAGPEEQDEAEPGTINLMEALKKSLAGGHGSHHGHARRRSA